MTEIKEVEPAPRRRRHRRASPCNGRADAAAHPAPFVDASGAVGELSLRAGIAASLAGHHLRLLRTRRLLRAERRGKQVIHSLRGARVGHIVVDLAAHAIEGRRRVEAPE